MLYVRECRVRATPEEVFRFHESPDALRQLIPPWENMRVVESSGSLRPGGRVVLRGRVGCLPVRWVAAHVEYDPPRSFTDVQESGPFALWRHRHLFLDDGQGGAILRDEIEFELPLAPLGRWLGGRFTRRKLEKMFAYRHETTKRLVETGRFAAAAPRAETGQSVETGQRVEFAPPAATGPRRLPEQPA